MQKEIRKQRQSNFELLRIIAMFLIVIHHFGVHGNFEFSAYSGISINSLPLLINKYWLLLLSLLGPIGVNVFVLISGYFLISKKEVNIKKIVFLFSECLFYSVILYIFVAVLINKEEFNIKNFFDNLITPLHNWWFAKSYITLYIFVPFINFVLNKLSKIKYKQFVIIIFTITCLAFTLNNRYSNFDNSNLMWLICLYSIGGYIRLYCEKTTNKQKYTILILLCFVIYFVYITFTTFIYNVFNVSEFVIELTTLNSDLVELIVAISLFMIFKDINIQNNKINIISSTTFGIYLIHETSFTRYLIWNNIFKVYNYSLSIFLIPYSILTSLIVFIIASLIDYLRISFIEKHCNVLFDKITLIIKRIINKISYLFFKLL